MKSLTSFQELEVLGAALAKKYTADTHRWNAGCFDIEGFITDGLRLPIVYERFAEDDPGKIGFLADGRTPLFILKNGRKESVIFFSCVFLERITSPPANLSVTSVTVRIIIETKKVCKRVSPMLTILLHTKMVSGGKLSVKRNYIDIKRGLFPVRLRLYIGITTYDFHQ